MRGPGLAASMSSYLVTEISKTANMPDGIVSLMQGIDPAVSLALSFMAIIARTVRSSMLTALGQDVKVTVKPARRRRKAGDMSVVVQSA